MLRELERAAGERLLIDETTGDGEVALHVTFSDHASREQEVENRLLASVSGTKHRELRAAEITRLFGQHWPASMRAWAYAQDGRVSPSWQRVLGKVLKQKGQRWTPGVRVRQVLVDTGGVAGVELQHVASGQRQFQPCRAAVLSLGYGVQYEYEGAQPWWPVTPFTGPVEETMMASGFSGYALIRGRIPIVGTRNSHWTELATDGEHSIVKCTGGGAVGTRDIPPSFGLNNIAHLRTMLGPRYLGMLEVGPCSRAINGRNDVRLTRVWPGLLVSSAQGGTGITKMGALARAYLALVTHEDPGAVPRWLLTDRTRRTALALGLRRRGSRARGVSNVRSPVN